GSKLYCDMEERARRMGVRNIMSIISMDNEESLKFHEKHGFIQAARFEDIAEKFGRSLGVVYALKRL
ncbi:MAG: GNAT family N-acetyltransferase, partial [Clostridia bacterium]|nr:GNAT family N-acetyltransferase [Clostridia bacterium]